MEKVKKALSFSKKHVHYLNNLQLKQSTKDKNPTILSSTDKFMLQDQQAKTKLTAKPEANKSLKMINVSQDLFIFIPLFSP